MNLKQLREKRAEKLEALQALNAKAEGEKRSLTKEEKEQWEAINNEVDELAADIAFEEKREARAAELAASAGVPATPSNKPKELRQYSVLRALSAMAEGRQLDGVELEMHQEAQREARANGVDIKGVGIPGVVLQAEKRDNSITMPTQPEDGSVLVNTDQYGSMAEMLRNALVTRRLGATYLTGLTNNISFTRMTERPKATWKPEVGTLDKSNVKFAADEMAPKRLGTYIVQSLQFLRQTSAAVERQIRQEIIYAVSEGVDEAAINGTGANNQPLGILNNPAVTAMATATGALNRSNLLAAETTLAARNLTGQSYAWLINAVTRGYIKGIKLDEGSGRFLMENNNSLLEYPVVMSNLVPSNLGTETNASAAIFGDWSELFIGQWGGIDLTVDPYTLLLEGQVKIVAQGFFNLVVRRPEAFVKYTDIAAS